MVLADFNIGDSIERGTTELFAWLPHLLGALAVLVIGYFVAKVIANLIGRVLHRGGLDRTVQRGQVGSWVSRVTHSPSRLLGRIAFWALMFGVFALAASVLGIDALEAFVATVWAYIPNVIVALAIFLVAGAISAAVAGLATRVMGDTGIGKVIATAAPILVMTIATFMILDQLMIAESIVTITYAGLVGAIALASALAFGLGGREVARQMLQGAYDGAQQNKDQWKSDLDRGMSRAKDEAASMKDEMTSDGGDGAGAGSEVPVPTGHAASVQGAYTTHPAGGISGSEPAYEPATERMHGNDSA
jgi:hypothetical protein